MSTTSTPSSNEPKGLVNQSDLFAAASYAGMKAVEKSENQKGKAVVKNALTGGVVSGLSRYLQNQNFLSLNSLVNLWDDQYTYNFILAAGYDMYCGKDLRHCVITGVESAAAGYLGDKLSQRKSGGDKNIV